MAPSERPRLRSVLGIMEAACASPHGQRDGEHCLLASVLPSTYRGHHGKHKHGDEVKRDVVLGLKIFNS